MHAMGMAHVWLILKAYSDRLEDTSDKIATALQWHQTLKLLLDLKFTRTLDDQRSSHE